MASKMMLKEIEFDTSGEYWTATYRVNKLVAAGLQAIITANENCETHGGETPYAIYQVRRENNRFYADFIYKAHETNCPEDQFRWGPIHWDLTTAGWREQ